MPGARRRAARRRARPSSPDVLELHSRRRASPTSSRALGKLKCLADASPKTCQGALPGGRARRPDLDPLPIMTCWPDDGGPFITLPSVITRDPRDGRAQRRHVPAAASTTRSDGAALADPQGRRRGLAARARAAWRSRSRSAPTRSRPTPARRRCRSTSTSSWWRLPARPARRARAVPDGRPAGAGARRDRDRGLLRARRAAPEGPFGDHTGLLHAGGAVPGAARDRR